MAPGSIISRYMDCEVEVIYLTDSNVYRDKGMLTECDGTFVSLQKPANELFLIPLSAIRIIKVLSSPKEPVSTLLRPAEPGEEIVARRISSPGTGQDNPS